MQATQILDIIKGLTLREKLLIAEQIFRDIREETQLDQDEDQQRLKAAELLAGDYEIDEELTAFTSLDKDEFYEEK